MSASELPSSMEQTLVKTKTTFLRHLLINGVVFIVLIALAVVGIAINDYSSLQGYHYWVGMGVLLTVSSVATEWWRAIRERRNGREQIVLLVRLLLHWGGLFIALYLILLLQNTTGRMNNEDAGLTALLTVAVVTFLAGVTYNWHFALVGVLLIAGVVASALIETYFWMIWIITLFVVGLGVAVFWWSYRIERARERVENLEHD